MIGRPCRTLLLGGVVLVTSGCFASVAQLDELREELNTERAESAAVDSVRAVQLVQILSTLRAVNDSMSIISTRLNRARAESQGDIRGLRQDVTQVQEISGQSQQRLQEIRAALEQRNRQAAASVLSSPPPAAAGDTVTALVTPPPAPVEEAPGPNELFQIARDQLTRGANGAARAAFLDLLKRYPDFELAADAQFYVAESYASEGKTAPADAAYATVVSKYGESPRAPTALYKRGVMAQAARRTITARRRYNELIDKYPASDEAELARERLRLLT